MSERVHRKRTPPIAPPTTTPLSLAPMDGGAPQPAPGHDFSRIRVHTDARAEESGRAVDAVSRTVRRSGLPLIQRDTAPGGLPPAPLPSLLPALSLPSDGITLDAGEEPSVGNAKLIQLAESYKSIAASSPRAYIKMSTYLSDAAKMNSATASQESARHRQRMAAARDVLAKLGVPESSVEIEPATAFSSKGAGQITASLYKAPQPAPSFGPLPGGPASPGPAGPGGPGKSLSDLLSFKFKAGPVEFAVELPKSAGVKLPVALSAAASLAFELKAEASGEFSFSIILDDQPHVRVAAKAGVKIDKDKGTSGSAGLEISTLSTVCSAPSPDALRTKITAAGEKLKKAMKELETAKEEDRLLKLADVGGAIGEMYDAVEKAKGSCKQVPRATINLGVQGPLKPNDDAVNDPDPNKRPSTYIGGSVTIPF